MRDAPVPAELIARYDVPAPRYTSYPTVPAWTALFGPGDYRAALAELAEADGESLALYVHVPFCEYRCHYCACNVTVSRRHAELQRAGETFTIRDLGSLNGT